MTKEYLSQKIETIEEALKLADNELKMLLNDEEVEKIRSQIIRRENILNELNKINLILLVTGDNDEKVKEFIELMRSSSDEDEAIKMLMEKYTITSIQAETMTGISLQELCDTNHEYKKSIYLDELNLIEKELNENSLFNSLEEKDIKFLIKSMGLNISLSEFFLINQHIKMATQ